MTDTTDKNKKTSTLTISSGKLSLSKPFESGQIRQNFSHGRSRTVTVEVKKTRTLNPNEKTKHESYESAKSEAEKVFDQKIIPSVSDDGTNLTKNEQIARLSALKNAAIEYEENKIKTEQLNIIKSKQLAEEQELQRINATQEIKEIEAVNIIDQAKPEAVSVSSTDSNISNKVVEDDNNKKKLQTNVKHNKTINESDESANSKIAKKIVKVEVSKPTAIKNRWDDKRKLSVSTVKSDDDDGRSRSIASIKRAREKARRLELAKSNESEKIIREVILPEFISVQELASRMAEKSSDVVRELMKLGMMVNVNQNVDADTAELITQTFGHKVKRVTESDVENVLIEENDDENTLISRAPVVTVMGHVDHGKTSLLDALRSTDVATGEAGGITQHIGAYRIQLASGQYITFLDTPGHEAFTAMRSRGAKATDIVILVVAADDGIMAQTIEAINHAKAADVPIIVAINKIDKPGADPSRARTELLNHGLVPEELGGDIMVIEVSAKQKINLEKLEEAIILQSEVLDLKANPNRSAAGVVIESKIDKGRGVVATILVQKGTLRNGDIVVAGASFGRVKVIHDDKGHILNEAMPSVPVEILGLSSTPEAGDVFSVVQNEKQAREIAEYRFKRSRAIRTTGIGRLSLDEMFSKASGVGIISKELPVIIKADVQGSIEAIAGSITKLANEEIKIKILHSAVGGITESDITLARASNAIVLGFNVRATNQARLLANKESVDIRYYSIIYNLIDDIRAAMSGMLSPILREEYLGTVEIRQIFNITKTGKVAGSFVTVGIVKKGARVRLLRDNIVIHEGKLKTLKRFKEDVREVKEGYECGIAFENYDDIREKDTVEVFEIIEEKQVLK
jgi:translation initiation factor IF-2